MCPLPRQTRGIHPYLCTPVLPRGQVDLLQTAFGPSTQNQGKKWPNNGFWPHRRNGRQNGRNMECSKTLSLGFSFANCRKSLGHRQVGPCLSRRVSQGHQAGVPPRIFLILCACFFSGDFLPWNMVSISEGTLISVGRTGAIGVRRGWCKYLFSEFGPCFPWKRREIKFWTLVRLKPSKSLRPKFFPL